MIGRHGLVLGKFLPPTSWLSRVSSGTLARRWAASSR